MRRLLVCSMVATLLTAWALYLQGEPPAAAPAGPTGERREFQGWPKPDLALVVTGNQQGYIEPCGCTGLENQKGGLARRHTLLKILRRHGWPVMPIDAGNQVRRIGVQAAIKFQSTVDAMRQMEYRAVGLGHSDLRLALGELIAAVVASTDEQGQSDLFVGTNANLVGFMPNHRVIEQAGVRVGILSVLGDEQLKKVTHDEVIRRPAKESVRDALAELREKKCDVTVLLADASLEQSRELGRAFPKLDVIVTTGGHGEPSYQPETIAGSPVPLVRVGDKGMYVGVIGLFRDTQDPSKQPTLRYQRIPLDKRFPDSPEMRKVMADYQEKLKDLGLAGLGLRPVPHPRGKFVGSETCGECHTRAFEKWQTTPHQHATDSLIHPNTRSDVPRHYDPECLSCHVTGWDPQGYFPYETGYWNLEQSKHLTGNGCENCHGPGKAHVEAESGDAALSDDQIEKLRLAMRLPLGEPTRDKCMECHDLDNSPDFHKEGAFEKYWKEIVHPWRD